MLRLRQIALVAHELEPVLASLKQELGVEVAFRDPSVKTFGLQNAVMPIGNQFLEVVSPIQENTAGGRYLERRKGDTGYMVILQCDEHARRKARLADMVRFAMAHDSDDYKILQLHPADTGGSFLEIDQQTGGEDIENGPWEPAGKDWQRARRTGIVGGINAAVIQSPDPVRLANRWSELLEVPVEGGDENPSIPLDNATLMFVEATDGRGEGLSGLYLAPGNDPQAPKRVQICGMDIQVEGAAPA